MYALTVLHTWQWKPREFTQMKRSATRTLPGNVQLHYPVARRCECAYHVTYTTFQMSRSSPVGQTVTQINIVCFETIKLGKNLLTFLKYTLFNDNLYVCQYSVTHLVPLNMCPLFLSTWYLSVSIIISLHSYKPVIDQQQRLNNTVH